MTDEQKHSDVWAAMMAVQGALRGVKRDSKNPHFKNSYASLEAVTDTIRPHCQANELVWLQAPGRVHDGSIEVTTRIHHPKSGSFHEFTMDMPLAKRDPQGAGSAVTYAMRYSLMAAFGLPPTDDDAETAIDRDQLRAEPEAPAKSSAQLKREGEWERVSREVAEAMNDVRTFGDFERMKESYRKEAKAKGWNATFTAQLKDLFEGYEADLRKTIEAENAGDVVQDIVRNMGGTVRDERVISTLQAG